MFPCHLVPFCRARLTCLTSASADSSSFITIDRNGNRPACDSRDSEHRFLLTANQNRKLCHLTSALGLVGLARLGLGLGFVLGFRLG